MELLEIKGIVDFGLVILIVMVQGLIYPSFLFYKPTDLQRWHTVYTKRIFKVVFPLMTAQLALSIMFVMQKISIYTVGSLVGIAVLFLLTALVFVPIHQKITRGHADIALLKKLVNQNWWRTVIWGMLFALTLVEWVLNHGKQAI